MGSEMCIRDRYLIAAGGTPAKLDSQSNALMRNEAGQFKNIAVDSRTDDHGFGQGVAVGDVNEDGFPDVLVLNYGPNRLYRSQGDGRFRDSTAQWLPDNADRWSTSGSLADLNGDAIADIVIVN